MPEHAWAQEDSDEPGAPVPVSRPATLTLEAYVNREFRAMAAEGRSMAAWLASISTLREQGLLPDLDIDRAVAGIRQARSEREARIEEW